MIELAKQSSLVSSLVFQICVASNFRNTNVNLYFCTTFIITEDAEMSAIPVYVEQEEVALFFIMATQMLQMIRLSSRYHKQYAL